MALLRLTVMMLIALTVIYWALVLYLRAGEKDRLEARWEAERPPLPQHTYVANGLRDYQGSLRRKLIWGVYVVPIGTVAALVYILNYA